ncbi:MAG: hypothetical protein ABH805_00580 [Candidatus Nealsonbacteria bacterium]
MALWFKNSITFLLIPLLLSTLVYLMSESVKADVVSVTIQVNSVCGDSVIEAQEQCEGLDLNGQTCQSIGYQSGDLACTPGCLFDKSSCVPVPTLPGGGGGGTTFVPPPSAKVVLKGKAYPNAVLNVLKYGELVTTFRADESGLFEQELDGLLEGTYIFGIWAQDEAGRKSATLTFPISLFWGMSATLNGIYMPPTISFEPDQVEKGGQIEFSGSAFPGDEVGLFISQQGQPIRTAVSANGRWSYALDTSSLNEGSHSVRAKSFFGVDQSPFSNSFSFWIGPFVSLPSEEEEIKKSADLNLDGSVNLIDLSILLFWWGRTDIDLKTRADINSDLQIDITDFSIMMYWWTG